MPLLETTIANNRRTLARLERAFGAEFHQGSFAAAYGSLVRLIPFADVDVDVIVEDRAMPPFPALEGLDLDIGCPGCVKHNDVDAALSSYSTSLWDMAKFVEFTFLAGDRALYDQFTSSVWARLADSLEVDLMLHLVQERLAFHRGLFAGQGIEAAGGRRDLDYVCYLESLRLRRAETAPSVLGRLQRQGLLSADKIRSMEAGLLTHGYRLQRPPPAASEYRLEAVFGDYVEAVTLPRVSRKTGADPAALLAALLGELSSAATADAGCGGSYLDYSLDLYLSSDSHTGPRCLGTLCERYMSESVVPHRRWKILFNLARNPSVAARSLSSMAQALLDDPGMRHVRRLICEHPALPKEATTLLRRHDPCKLNRSLLGGQS